MKARLGPPRHKYSSTQVGGFPGLAQNGGYLGIFEPPFSDQGGRMTILNWKQNFAEGKMTAVGGWMDVTDYVDVYLLASPWTGFNNFVFSTGSAAMDLPNDAALGAGSSKNGLRVGPTPPIGLILANLPRIY